MIQYLREITTMVSAGEEFSFLLCLGHGAICGGAPANLLKSFRGLIGGRDLLSFAVYV